MPKLVDLDILEVSGVDKAANGRRFLIVKRAEPADEPEEVVTKALTDEDKSAYKADLKDSSTQDLTAGHRRIHQWAGSGALPTGLSKTDLVWMHNALVDELRRRFKEENPDKAYEHDSPLKVEDIPDSPGDVEKCKAITNLTSRVKEREEKKVKKGGSAMGEEGAEVRREESKGRALLRLVKSFFAGAPAPVEKAEARTVNEILADQKQDQLLWDLVWALQDSIQSIMDDETLTDKAAAVVETVSQFQAQVLGSGIVKRGAKISADRLSRLKQAHDLLGQIIGEAEAKDDETVAKGEGSPRESQAGAPAPQAAAPNSEPLAGGTGTQAGSPDSAPDLEALVQKAVAPLLERLSALEQAPATSPDPDAGASQEPAAGPSSPDPAAVTAAVSKALEPLIARIEALEKARGIKKSIDGQDGSTKESLWTGIL